MSLLYVAVGGAVVAGAVYFMKKPSLPGMIGPEPAPSITGVDAKNDTLRTAPGATPPPLPGMSGTMTASEAKRVYAKLQEGVKAYANHNSQFGVLLTNKEYWGEIGLTEFAKETSLRAKALVDEKKQLNDIYNQNKESYIKYGLRALDFGP